MDVVALLFQFICELQQNLPAPRTHAFWKVIRHSKMFEIDIIRKICSVHSYKYVDKII